MKFQTDEQVLRKYTLILGGLFCRASLLVARAGGRVALGGGLGKLGKLAASFFQSLSSEERRKERSSGWPTGSGLSGMRDM